MRRCKLYLLIAPLAFFVGLLLALAGRQAMSEAATFTGEQFAGNRADNLFPC